MKDDELGILKIYAKILIIRLLTNFFEAAYGAKT
jgi:hypothetical protein